MISAHLTGDKIVSSTPEAFTLCDKSFFGEKKHEKIEYPIIEALFLIEQGKMKVFVGRNEKSFEELLKKFKKIDKKIETNFTVYADIRKRGYIVKSALKFGAEFRVYDQGIRPREDHARWIVYTAKEHSEISWHDFAAKNRVAHSTKKNLLLAIVDDEDDVSYYECSWLKL